MSGALRSRIISDGKRLAALAALPLLFASPALAFPASPATVTAPPSSTAPPVISGAAQDGQTLTATPGSWSSSSTLTYKYQWQRCDGTGANCANISGATKSSYLLTSASVGHQVTVVVTATDASKQTGKASAAPVGPVAPPPPPSKLTLPMISGTPQDGQTLTTTNGTWASPDALVYHYQWQRCNSTGSSCTNISAATKSSYKLTSNDVGHEMTVVVSAIDKEKQSTPATAAAVGPVAAPPPPSNATLPVISGTPQDSQRLTTTPGTWTSPDTLGYHYQWERCDNTGSNCVSISKATAASYTLASADVGHDVTVLVTANDREGQSGHATATPVGPVAPPPPPSVQTLPVISGPAQATQTLSVSNGSWSSFDKLTYSYQWQRCDNTGSGCVNIDGQIAPFYTPTSADVGHQVSAVVTATDAENQSANSSAAPVGPVAAGPELTGIHKIQHIVVIMQENRSFDNYFGTYPGADGIPAGVCIPDPHNGGCAAPYHDSADKDLGGPHGYPNAGPDIDGGKMDGFVGQAEHGCTNTIPICSPCSPSLQSGCVDVMGYHDSQEIPNYWTYAHDFVLQDHMFEAVPAQSGPSHLYTVSGWSATCSNHLDPATCTTNINNPGTPTTGTTLFPWTDITYLLHAAGISWAYYVFQGTEPDCEINTQLTCAPVQQGAKTPGIWNPLISFQTVNQDGQAGNVQSLDGFYKAAKAGALPAVSWIVPNGTVSEHPPSLISAGQTYVTGLVNTIMQSPDWGSTAIFISWDDWGGFYDHVVPPSADENGYGLRVPGLMISPYAKNGFIDSQTLSHDAYLKFIEDDFLGGQRIDPATDGRPDPRPDVRENAAQLGDLASEFDFSQTPRAPVLLPVCPQTDLTPAPSC